MNFSNRMDLVFKVTFFILVPKPTKKTKGSFLEPFPSHPKMISCCLLGTVFRFSSVLKNSPVINKNEEVKDYFYLQILLDNVAPVGT